MSLDGVKQVCECGEGRGCSLSICIPVSVANRIAAQGWHIIVDGCRPVTFDMELVERRDGYRLYRTILMPCN